MVTGVAPLKTRHQLRNRCHPLYLTQHNTTPQHQCHPSFNTTPDTGAIPVPTPNIALQHLSRHHRNTSHDHHHTPKRKGNLVKTLLILAYLSFHRGWNNLSIPQICASISLQITEMEHVWKIIPRFQIHLNSFTPSNEQALIVFYESFR